MRYRTSNLSFTGVALGLLTCASLLAQQGPSRGGSSGAASSGPSAGSTGSSFVAGGSSYSGVNMSSHGFSGMGAEPRVRLAPVSGSAPVRTVPIPVRDRSVSNGSKLTRAVLPPATDRCTRQPDEHYWSRRDILNEIRYLARMGSIPVTLINDEIEIADYAWVPSGWRAYGLVVPAGEKVEISLDHTNRGWFRLTMCNKWGELEQGMLQNVIHRFEPVVTYSNPHKQARAIYFVVDDPGWMSTAGAPYTLTINRSWDPKDQAKGGSFIDGIWTPYQPKEPPVQMAKVLWGDSGSVSAALQNPRYRRIR